jgi:hypothetical protein
VSARRASLLALVGVAAFAAFARADGRGPLLHEYFPPEEVESITLATLGAPGGAKPTTIDTPSGPITEPDLSTPAPTSPPYRRDPESTSSSYQPDRDTRRPESETYDDPFTPQLTPYKRMFAFDAVREDYSLYVRDPQPRVVSIRDAVVEGDDRFFADLVVDLPAHASVRIPTPAAGTRALRLESSPAQPLTLLQDGADNWFVRSEREGRARLVLTLSTPREAFAGSYPDVPWRALPVVPTQPPAHRAAFERVAAAIGLNERQPPREVVQRMTAYFRSFAPSTEPPTMHGDLYLDLALSKKGVCRHRAFAFLVTSLHAGIPTRFVHNEAHAWVEVKDDRLWHRIDLGGAAVDLQGDPHLERPQHVPPPDPLPWPNGRDSGEDLGTQERRRAERDVAQRARANGPDASGPEAVDRAAPSMTTPDRERGEGGGHDGASMLTEADRPPSEVLLDDVDHDLFRGKPMRLRGKVRADGEACAQLRVDVIVVGRGAGQRRVGSLATDERGTFDGAVTLPTDLPVGDYELQLVTPGNRTCGPGQSK